MSVLARHPDAELTAICESDALQLANCKNLAESADCKVECYHDFDRFIEHDMDAVVLANFATEHAPYAVRLLDSGRHVMSELMPCQNMAEAVQLVEAVERSGKVYSYAENVCYIPAVLEMQRLYAKGDIGEFMMGEGQYVHDCEPEWPAFTRGQRGHWRNWTPASFYVTHSTGPLLTITGTRPVRVTGYETPNVNKRRYGAVSADASMIMCQMDNGGVCTFVPWAALKRGYMIWFSVYGSGGSMEMDRWGDWSKISVYKNGDSEGTRHYQVDYPMDMQEAAKGTDHGGADFFASHYFLEAILDRPGKANAIDVYQALDMTYPGMLGFRSIWQGNQPIDVPDLKKQEERDKYREDTWCADPKMAGPSQPDASCVSEKVEIPDDFYKRQQAELKISLETEDTVSAE